MPSSVETYRVYCFDDVHAVVTAELIEAVSDDEAIAKAQAAGFGSKCEIWHRNRLVAKLEGERRIA